MVDQSFRIGNVEFRNRVFVASGTFGYGDEVIDIAEVSKLGAIVTKSITARPRAGNPPRRIVETPCGMLNSIGLANMGVAKFINEKLPALRNLGTKTIISIAGSTVDEYADVVDQLESAEQDVPEGWIAGYELNVSCPNVKEGGLEFGTNPRTVEKITRLVRERTRRLLITKLTPNVTKIGDIACAAEQGGADAVSAINTFIGMAVNVHERVPRLSTVTGGLSGPAIKPIALAKVYECVQSVKIPVIGIGGITTVNDAIEFLLVGAWAVQVGTTNFVDPNAAPSIADGLAAYCEQMGIASVGELVGALSLPGDLRSR